MGALLAIYGVLLVVYEVCLVIYGALLVVCDVEVEGKVDDDVCTKDQRIIDGYIFIGVLYQLY